MSHQDPEQDYRIEIWPFDKAPKELQALSENGGDEDWLAVVPQHSEGVLRWPPIWMAAGTSFGCFCVDSYPHPTRPGYLVMIGAHA